MDLFGGLFGGRDGTQRFADRYEAGRLLAARLAAYEGRADVVVLGLPRGGVPVAFELARSLRATLDVFVVRKLGVPGREELAMGALASGGVRVVNRVVVEALGIPVSVIDSVAASEALELERRERLYRDDRPAPDVTGRTVILVDDGLATGSTMRAAAAALRELAPARTIVAAPVAAADTCAELRSEVDEIVCLRTPPDFQAVGLWYRDFSPTTDEEVRRLLAASAAGSAGVEARSVHVPAAGVELAGDLVLPVRPHGVILFAHGSGSSRFSRRNREVAAVLHGAGLSTLLIDLLTHEEEQADARSGHLRFDIGLLAHRLIGALDWLAASHETAALPIGLFGASTGAAGALVAAAERPDVVRAVVSRGGRPDLAGAALEHVGAPTLLIVGGADSVVLGMNRDAAEHLRAPHDLRVVEGAGHLFEEPGALRQVADLARDWFVRHLAGSGE